MSTQTDISSSSALLTAPKNAAPPAASMIVRIAREFSVSPLTQLQQMTRLRFGPGKLAAHEYVSTRAFDPGYSFAEKTEFVGRIGSWALNAAASPEALTASRGFVRDKVLYTQLLRGLGIPAAETQALIHTTRRLGNIPVLRDPQQISEFLTQDARFPLFGKPVEGAGSIGSVLIQTYCAASGDLLMGNGATVSIGDFSKQVVRDYPEGFIFQSAIAQHPDLSAVIGQAVGTIRTVTVRTSATIAPLYSVWKIPAPGAMSDNYWQQGSMIGLVAGTGALETVYHGSGPDWAACSNHPVSDVVMKGLQIPHWQHLQEMVCQAHSVFPEFGVIGWDVAITEHGPVIIEANDNPFHALYQTATGRGARNSEFLAQFTAAAAESERLLANRISVHQSRERAKKRK